MKLNQGLCPHEVYSLRGKTDIEQVATGGMGVTYRRLEPCAH